MGRGQPTKRKDLVSNAGGTKRPVTLDDITYGEMGPMFYANEEHLVNFNKLITDIMPTLEKYGSVKIIMPEHYKSCSDLDERVMKLEITRLTHQRIRQLNEHFVLLKGTTNTKITDMAKKSTSGEEPLPKRQTPSAESRAGEKLKCMECGQDQADWKMSFEDYMKYDDSPFMDFPENGLTKLQCEEVALAYWERIFRLMIKDDRKLQSYGTDCIGTLYKFGEDRWTMNNLPGILTDIFQNTSQGLSISNLYFGLWLTTFANHIEDDDLFALNLLSWGGAKFWYTIKRQHYLEFLRESLPSLQQFSRQICNDDECKQLFRHKQLLSYITFFRDKGIPLVRHVQQKGEMIIVAPRVMHFGFNMRANVAEAVNWAPVQTIDFMLTATRCVHMKQTVSLLWVVYKYRFQQFSKYLEGQMTVVDPDDRTVKIVPAPDISIADPQLCYEYVSSRVSSVLAYFVHKGTQIVLVECAGSKLLLAREDVEALEWRNVGNDGGRPQLVKIPDIFFAWDQPHPPPTLIFGNQVVSNGNTLQVEEYLLTVFGTSNANPTVAPQPTSSCSTQGSNSVQIENAQNVRAFTQKKPLEYFTEDGELRDGIDFTKCPNPFCKKPDLSGIVLSHNRRRHVRDCFSAGRYNCSHCDSFFKYERRLKEHIKRKHKDLQPDSE